MAFSRSDLEIGSLGKRGLAGVESQETTGLHMKRRRDVQEIETPMPALYGESSSAAL